MLKQSLHIAFACSAFALPALGAITDSPKVGANLRAFVSMEKHDRADIMVYMTKKADLSGAKSLKNKADKGAFVVRALRDTAAESQKDVIAVLEKSGVRFQSYFVDNVIAVYDAPLSLIEQLAGMKDVGEILHDPLVEILPQLTEMQTVDEKKETVSTLAIEASITSTGANRVWTELNNRGEGIVIANQDTGIQWNHPALIRSYRGSLGSETVHDYNWHDAIHQRISGSSNPCGYKSRVPCDDHGHGTHTLGTSVGDDGNGNQIGMAPGAKWIACRNMDNGYGRPSTYLECFQFFLAPWPYGADPATAGDPSKAPDVINNSWGCPSSEGCNGTEFLNVINALNEAGIMTVAAAGNAGSSCTTINDGPAHHTEEVLVVGAHDHRSGSIASFSSRGPSKFDGLTSPDLTAPGVNIRSSIPGSRYAGSMWSGTSMASPHVTGAVALLWSARPELRGDIDGTVNLLRNTATGKTSTQTCGGVSGQRIPNNTFGHGHLNVYKAVTGS